MHTATAAGDNTLQRRLGLQHPHTPAGMRSYARLSSCTLGSSRHSSSAGTSGRSCTCGGRKRGRDTHGARWASGAAVAQDGQLAEQHGRPPACSSEQAPLAAQPARAPAAPPAALPLACSNPRLKRPPPPQPPHLGQLLLIHQLVVGDGIQLHALVELVALAAHQHCGGWVGGGAGGWRLMAVGGDCGKIAGSRTTPTATSQLVSRRACTCHAAQLPPGTRCAWAISATAAVPTRDSTVPLDSTEAAPRNTFGMGRSVRTALVGMARWRLLAACAAAAVCRTCAAAHGCRVAAAAAWLCTQKAAATASRALPATTNSQPPSIGVYHWGPQHHKPTHWFLLAAPARAPCPPR